MRLKNLLNECVTGEENGQETTTMIQTRNHNAMTKAKDVPRDILETGVIGLECGQ